MSAEDRNRIAADLVAAFARVGSRHFIANLDTSVRLHRWGDHLLPMTVNDGARSDTFVCSPRVGYVDYPLEELADFPNRALVPILRAIVKAAGGVLAWSDADRIVHINNWMMSTNLPVPLDPSLASEQTSSLAHAFPDHLVAMRSLTTRHSAPMIDALQKAGWAMVPSRQVFLVDDVESEVMVRRDAKRDERLWKQARFSYEELTGLAAADAARIVELYQMLYRRKYSRLNPDYTTDFVHLTHRIELIRYLVLRDCDGIIRGFGGMHRSGGHATMPLIGYDTSAPQEDGWYRLTFHAGTRYAARHRLRLNMSSGAGSFKRNRGASGEMEFTAFYLGHLASGRKLAFGALRKIADYIGAPLLKKYGL